MMAVVAACVSAPAYAMMDDSRMDGMMQHKMEMMDTNKDGMISKEEMRAHSDMMFAKSDTNNDGMISAEEMKVSHDLKREEMKKYHGMGKKETMDSEEKTDQ